jgi:PRA1 family protein
MDWNHVTAAEVASALREVRDLARMVVIRTELPRPCRTHTILLFQVDWKSPPRPLWEMLQPSRFTVPRSRKKWAARAKNSAYYYRVNYAVMLLVRTIKELNTLI